MKVLVAAPDTKRIEVKKDDFNHATEGELLTLGSVCDGDASHRRRCGCGRAFSGIDSAKATTFGIVAEMDDVTVERIVTRSAYVDGWTIGDDRASTVKMVMDDLRMISEMLDNAKVGDEGRVSMTPTRVKLTATNGDNLLRNEEYKAWLAKVTEATKALWPDVAPAARAAVNLRIKARHPERFSAWSAFEAGVSADDFATYVLTGDATALVAAEAV